MNKTTLYKIFTIAIIIFAIVALALTYIMAYDFEAHKYKPKYISQTILPLAMHLAFIFFFLLNYFSQSKPAKVITSILLLIISFTYLFFAILLRTELGITKEMYGGSGIVILGCLFPMTIIYFYLKQKIKS